MLTVTFFRNNRAVGVEYAAHSDFNPGEDSKSQTEVVYASRMVVLSSGAFGSPAILERYVYVTTSFCIACVLTFYRFFASIFTCRSGIGSTQHLAEAHVDQVVDLPGVGENYNGLFPILVKRELYYLFSFFSPDLKLLLTYFMFT